MTVVLHSALMQNAELFSYSFLLSLPLIIKDQCAFRGKPLEALYDSSAKKTDCIMSVFFFCWITDDCNKPNRYQLNRKSYQRSSLYSFVLCTSATKIVISSTLFMVNSRFDYSALFFGNYYFGFAEDSLRLSNSARAASMASIVIEISEFSFMTSPSADKRA